MALFCSSSGLGEFQSPLVVDVVLRSPEEGSGNTIVGADWWAEMAWVAAAMAAAHPPELVGRANRRALLVEFVVKVPTPPET